MGFWIYMLIMVALLPVTMIVLGRIFQTHPPKEMNRWFGYRRTCAMKTQETWDFANRYFGRLWFLFGVVLLIPNLVGLFCVYGKSQDFIGLISLLLIVVDVIFMLIPIYFTEKILRETFDENGKRR